MTGAIDAGNAMRSKRLWLWIGYWAFLFVIMHRPISSDIGLPIPWADKLIHLTLYFVLALLGGRYLQLTHDSDGLLNQSNDLSDLFFHGTSQLLMVRRPLFKVSSIRRREPARALALWISGMFIGV